MQPLEKFNYLKSIIEQLRGNIEGIEDHHDWYYKYNLIINEVSCFDYDENINEIKGYYEKEFAGYNTIQVEAFKKAAAEIARYPSLYYDQNYDIDMDVFYKDCDNWKFPEMIYN